MGSRNRPGKFDAYEKAAPDEPMFVLLARDPQAPALVRAWIAQRSEKGESSEKLVEASECADAMEAWYDQHRR